MKKINITLLTSEVMNQYDVHLPPIFLAEDRNGVEVDESLVC